MKIVEKLLKQVDKRGFGGVFPLAICKEGQWHDAYANFYIEFESNDKDLRKSFSQFLKKNIKDCRVYRRGNNIEVVGKDFDEIDDYHWDNYRLVEEIW